MAPVRLSQLQPSCFVQRIGTRATDFYENNNRHHHTVILPPPPAVERSGHPATPQARKEQSAKREADRRQQMFDDGEGGYAGRRRDAVVRERRGPIVQESELEDSRGGYTDLEVLELLDPPRAARMRLRIARWENTGQSRIRAICVVRWSLRAFQAFGGLRGCAGRWWRKATMCFLHGLSESTGQQQTSFDTEVEGTAPKRALVRRPPWRVSKFRCNFVPSKNARSTTDQTTRATQRERERPSLLSSLPRQTPRGYVCGR